MYIGLFVPGNATHKTTPLVASVTQGSGANAMNYTYTYDSRGNISKVVHNGKITSYKYDAVGQLTRVNDQTDTTSGVNGTTWVYYYNNHGGNFSSKRRYPYTPAGTSLPSTYDERIIYTYGDSKWKDKLTKYNGVSITYDAIGNPTNDGTWTYTWQAGRQLAGMNKSGTSVTFSYDHNGLRTQKVVTENNVSTTTNYQLHGKLVTEMTRGTDKLHFFYDAQSRPAMVSYNGVMYTYVHNLQGDIVGILDSTGAVVVEYSYDAWGRPTGVTGSIAGTLGALNPFRYRGYVYDEETGLYYLYARYYDCNMARFISADSAPVMNLFSYCFNKPINRMDTSGATGEYVEIKLHIWDTLNTNDHGHYDIECFGVILKYGMVRGETSITMYSAKDLDETEKKYKGHETMTFMVPKEAAQNAMKFVFEICDVEYNESIICKIAEKKHKEITKTVKVKSNKTDYDLRTYSYGESVCLTFCYVFLSVAGVSLESRNMTIKTPEEYRVSERGIKDTFLWAYVFYNLYGAYCDKKESN